MQNNASDFFCQPNIIHSGNSCFYRLIIHGKGETLSPVRRKNTRGIARYQYDSHSVQQHFTITNFYGVFIKSIIAIRVLTHPLVFVFMFLICSLKLFTNACLLFLQG
jgi:hypothetical protein